MFGGGRGPWAASPFPKGANKRVDRKTVKRVAAFFKPYRGRVALTIFAILLTAGIGLVNPILLKLIIDDAIPDRDLDKLYLYVGLMIALPVINGLIGVG